MSSELEKFLAKVTPKEKKVLDVLIGKILAHKLETLDIKKLTGHDDIFRVRKGIFRIIFKNDGCDSTIIFIERRNDTTYKNM